MKRSQMVLLSSSLFGWAFRLAWACSRISFLRSAMSAVGVIARFSRDSVGWGAGGARSGSEGDAGGPRADSGVLHGFAVRRLPRVVVVRFGLRRPVRVERHPADRPTKV